jgi:hypothetical protein
MSRERITQLIERIKRAFEGVPRPQITKSVARGYDDEWNLSDERIRELQAEDPEQRWQDVTEDDVRFFQEYFTFSDAEGWRFYLPAHMIYYLRGFPHYGWDAVYWALSHPEPKLELLSTEQSECVREFLSLVNEEERNEN